MKNVPKLRFKEFTDEWEEKKIENIVNNISSGKTKIDKDENGKYPLYGSTGQIGFTNSKDYTGENILIARVGANAGTLNIINKECGITDNTLITSVNKDNVNKWLYYYLINYNLNRLIFGSGQPLITGTQLKKINILIPNKIEQEKIADFLSSVDKKISITEEKLNLFNKYKKGIMQKIFNQELRFKDENGNDYPEWEEKKLGDILIKNKEKNKENKYNLVQSISNKYGFVNQDEYFEDRRVASKDLKNYYVAQKKLFAYNPSRINVGSLAYKKDNSISVISPLYVSFYTKKEELIDIFLLNWFFSLPFIKQMSCSFEGSVRNNLSYETLSNFIINVPCLEEQKKIADFLSAIDTKIEKTSDELENLKEFKKGLLQQMFV